MRRRRWFKKITHRQPMIHHTVAMVATIFPGGMQPYHHLVPPPIFAQVLGKAREIAFGQPFQLLYHLFAFVHGVKTMDPKHDLNLDFQRQHAAKRFVPGIHQPSAVHDDRAQYGMRPLCSGLPYSWVPGTNHLLAPGLGVPPKKVYPWGAPPRISSRGQTPHVMSLHQSAPLLQSLNPVARLV